MRALLWVWGLLAFGIVAVYLIDQMSRTECGQVFDFLGQTFRAVC